MPSSEGQAGFSVSEAALFPSPPSLWPQADEVKPQAINYDI